MEVSYYKEPWPHLIIDDVFENLEETKNSLLSSEYTNMNKVPGGGWNYFNIQNVKIAKQLDFLHRSYGRFFKQFRKHTELYHQIDLKITKSAEAFKVHDEAINRVFVMTIYLDPLHDNGTILFDASKNLKKIITWKPNRAFMFAPLTNVTWHAYGGYESHDRITLNSICSRKESDIVLDHQFLR